MSSVEGARNNRPESRQLVSAAILLAIVTLLCHGSALRGAWRVDDPQNLLYVVEHPAVLGYFFSPSQWQSTSMPFFTPWPALDYRLDYAFFGLDPSGFYAHHLLTIWIAALLTFALLYRSAGLYWGLFAAALFLIGSPVVVVSQQLMSRHYAVGLVFAVLAIMLWLRAHEKNGRMYLVLAAGCYLAAMLNKEVFAPLPLVLFFLGNGTLGTLNARLRALVPFALTATLYVAWRAVMLGEIVGGYTGGFYEVNDIPASLVTMTKAFFGDGWRALSGSLVLLLAGAVLLRSSRQVLAALIAIGVALSLPFLAIQMSTEALQLRHAFLPWWCACVLLSLGVARVSGECRSSIAITGPRRLAFGMARYLALSAALLVTILTAVKSLETSRIYDAVATEFDVQGRFLWEHDETAGYVPAGEVSKFLQFPFGLSRLKRELLAQGTPIPIPFADSAPLFHGTLPVHSYDPACRCMKMEGKPTSASTEVKGYDPALPLDIRLDRSDGRIAWDVKTAADRTCFFVFLALNGSTQLPCSGLVRAPTWLGGPFRFFVRTADGRWNASPTLVFPENGRKLQWSSEPYSAV